MDCLKYNGHGVAENNVRMFLLLSTYKCVRADLDEDQYALLSITCIAEV